MTPRNDADTTAAYFDRSFADFTQLHGPDLIARTRDFYRYFERRRDEHTWFYDRRIEGAPRRHGAIHGADERGVRGLNFGSQDYLSLSTHPAVLEAARRALDEFGPHSAGSPCAQGNTPLSVRLERELGEFLRMDSVLLFPTGWAAGYGSTAGLVGPDDHIVMDRLAHNCLQSGARGTTRHVRRCAHNDPDDLRRTLAEIRSDDASHGILVITEGLFSMDSDRPDIARTQAICREYGAVLLVDVAHDLGSSGPGGAGSIGADGMLGEVDLVMGSFSKTFASNGGFLAAQTPEATRYVKYYGASHMFSNALSPVQTSVVLETLRIVRSDEGEQRRRRLRAAVDALREAFAAAGRSCLGIPSAIVPVPIGSEVVARELHRRMSKRDLILQFVEFPVVAQGKARIRMQLMSDHTEEDARYAAACILSELEPLDSEHGGGAR